MTVDMEVVSGLRAAMARHIGQERFELWFGDDTKLSLIEGALHIRVPSQFVHDWLRSNLRREIEAGCREVFGQPIPIEFHVDLLASPLPADMRPADTNPPQASSEAPPAGSGSFAPRRRFNQLQSFVVGRSNKVAYASAQRVVEQLGSLSPLFLYGPTGVGKTHLLEGIWSAAKARNRQTHAVYLSAEQFMSLFLEALHGQGMPNFRRKYRGTDLLILDDLQFLAGKRATIVELLHTLDTLARDGRQLVLAADRPPADLRGLGPELATRLAGGLVCRMEPPDYETRLGIVRQAAARMERSIPPAVQEFVAAHLAAHARELLGALNRLEATSLALEVPVTLGLAEEALGDMIREGNRAVRLADIEKAVCDVFGLDPARLQQATKAKGVNQPRMLAMWLARKHTRAALSEIGRYFGRRSHSTVVSAQKKVCAWMGKGGSIELADRTCSVEEAIRRVEERLRAG